MPKKEDLVTLKSNTSWFEKDYYMSNALTYQGPDGPIFCKAKV